MAKIKKVLARQILDSRGRPTIETTVILNEDTWAQASVPSGASRGKHEAWELRDGGKAFGGFGVLKAKKIIEEVISPSLVGKNVLDQKAIDQLMIELDGTPNKKKLGANTILSVSLAVCRAAALSQKIPLYQYLYQLSQSTHKLSQENLPLGMFNILNGGKHADNNLDFQEFIIVPHLKTFSQNLRSASEIYFSLKEVLKVNNLTTLIGDEGGFAPHLKTNRQALDLISEAITRAGYQLAQEIFLAIDVAASNLDQDNLYVLSLEGRSLPANQLISLYNEWVLNYPLISIEDGLSEDDWAGWQKMNERLGKKVLLIGDDLFTTNLKRLERGIKEKAANAILIKPNQIGTLSETLEVVKKAKENNYQIVISHRSGETNDDFIADLAVGVGASYLKAGAPSRGERLAKYNRLLKIEEELK